MASDAGAAVARPDAEMLAGLLDREIVFPAGLLGFAGCRRYKLARFKPADGSDSPFLTLSAVDQQFSFALIHPGSIALSYQLPANPQILAALDVQTPDQLVTLLIMTVRDRLEEITVNLQGPLIINPESRLGCQLVVEDYPLRHRLFAVTP
jgi:flagellar assembly factor FliW